MKLPPQRGPNPIKDMGMADYARTYARIHCQIGISDTYNYMTSDTVMTDLTQYHVSKGIKKFGQEGVEAILRELKQIHDRMVIDPTLLTLMN